MSYNPEIHHRKSIRLKGYDYSKAGLYFITICTQNREHLFGKIENGKIILSIAGEIAYNEWDLLENRFKNIKLYEFVVMPNHIHGIIEIIGEEGVINNARTEGKNRDIENYFSKISPKSNSLSIVIRSYKSCVSKNTRRGVIYNAPNDNAHNKINFQWQRNYYEHIIRNEKSYLKISEYIKNNPVKWEEDKYYAK